MRKFLLLISVALMSATAMADKDTEGYMFKDAQGCYYLIISETEVMLTGVLNQNDVTEYTIPETVTHPDGKTFTVASIATNYRSVTTASGKSSKLVASTPTDAKKAMNGVSELQQFMTPFYYMEKLERLIIPKTIKDITTAGYYWTTGGNKTSLSENNSNILYNRGNSDFPKQVEIIIDADNPYLEKVDDVIFTEDGKKLLLYPTTNTRTSYTVPEGVEEIEHAAFTRTSQKHVDFLEKVVLPSTIKKIDDYAFAFNEKLNDINFPEGFTHIGNSAFRDTKSLRNISLPSTLTYIGAYGFNYSGLASINVPGSVKTILICTFSHCKEMESVVLNPGTETISESAFMDSPKMTSMTLPEGLKSIGSFAIAGCTMLPNLTLPSTLETIENYTFMFNTNMTSINIPTSLNKIGKGIFTACPNLETITVDSNNKRYTLDNDGGKLDKGVLYGNSGSNGEMDELVFFIPKNKIGANNKTMIKQWIIPNSVKKICAGSMGEHYIESLVLPSELQIIEELAFYRDLSSSLAPKGSNLETIATEYYKLRELTIPAKVSSVHASAFLQRYGTTKRTFIKNIFFMGAPTIALTEVNTMQSNGANITMRTDNWKYNLTNDDLAIYVKPSLIDDAKFTDLKSKAKTFSAEIPLRDAQVGENKVSSMCRDFDMDFSNATGVSAYIATSYDASVNEGAGGYKMQKVNYVPSRTGTENDEYHGVIIRMADPNAVVTYRIGENDYNSANPQVAFKDASDADVETTANRLVGVVVNSHVQGTEDGLQTWGLSSGKWQRIVNTGKLTPYNRAYLKPTTSETNSMTGKGGQNAKIAMSFVDDDNETTGIKNIGNNNGENTESDQWYTISGQRLYGTPTEKGIYIHNGKKEIIR